MIIESKKLCTQLQFLPIEEIDWDKDIKEHYEELGDLLQLYNFQLAPNETTIKTFLSSIVKRIGTVSNDELDAMFISDIYYFIIHWQKGISFKLKSTSIVFRKMKNWLMSVGMFVVNCCTLVGTIYLGMLVVRAIMR